MPGDPVAEFADGHPIDARRSLVRLHPLVGSVQVLRSEDLFQQTLGQGSCLVGRRRRLWPLGPGRSDAVVAALSVTRGLLVTFEVEGHLVSPGSLPLHAHRVVPDRSLARKIRPFVGGRRLLRPRLTSPATSRPVAESVVRIARTGWEISQGKS